MSEGVLFGLSCRTMCWTCFSIVSASQRPWNRFRGEKEGFVFNNLKTHCINGVMNHLCLALWIN